MIAERVMKLSEIGFVFDAGDLGIEQQNRRGIEQQNRRGEPLKEEWLGYREPCLQPDHPPWVTPISTSILNRRITF